MYRALVVLHLIGASIWIGGHLVLSLGILPRALRARDPSIVLDFEAVFERIGLPALLVQVVTGVLLARIWAPDWSTWIAPDSPQTWFILGKLVLLACTVVLAAHARLRLIPRLDATTLRPLAWHIVGVTVIGLLFLVFGVAVRTGGLL